MPDFAGGAIKAHRDALVEKRREVTAQLGMQVDADLAAQLLCETVLPRVRVVELGIEEVLAALRLARKHGVRGGAVYDFMHLVAARKFRAISLYTLNTEDFQHLRREGDPEIRRP